MASKNMSRVLSRYLRDLIVNSFIASPIVPVPARWRVLRRLGAEVERSFVAPRVSLGSISGLTIGKGTYINYGVTIGPGCVIGAGAVVTGDCEPNSVYAGVPARFVRSLA